MEKREAMRFLVLIAVALMTAGCAAPVSSDGAESDAADSAQPYELDYALAKSIFSQYYTCGEHAPVGLEELAPRRLFATLRGGFNSVLFQDVSDRRSTDSVAEVVQRTFNPRVAPSVVLSPHPDDELGDDLHHSRSAIGATFVRPLIGNELPMPAKYRVGRYERSDVGERPPTEGIAEHGEASTLIVGQSQTFAPQLLLEDAALLSQVVDRSILLASDPAGHRGDEDLPWVEHGRHPLIVAGSWTDRQLST